MGNVTFRVDDELKERSYQALQELGVTPSELLRQTLEYVAETGRLPFKKTLVTDEDEQILNEVRERLNNPQPVRVSLDDL
ncbi:type II toxin-antitoxin system RelB/DinJ family antitoxin [Oceanospirillum linum]|uniref:Bifunctional antitoxin/transcriptional repressor RelB n=1 Tax=Oceanospirillum linum TaxID=966 RepID=A0A1T1H9A7_OCELI|nr:type II toxin-antitoxin system RelB/DinJ family antitoxin [Oceanospirillum linum]OOV86423.1 bifunctional antitoxin/transcriptional repressor RelB [Oceanospirillum linum]SEG32998.1 RHH-type transcriptional regulator, rel operon repressor / antitoxin RelB [Oleiphilus messinensis]SMP28970.1 RHH-type transcriptional regulator, rel operon repressor / antitoxin RelB [Oceanospirillum linum]